jgi:DNA-binding MarR family transcriptional regulator
MSAEKMKGLNDWHALYQAYNALFKVQEIALIPQGISLPQLHLLALLAYEQRPLAVSELAAWMVKEPNSLTGLVDRTEAKGGVPRRPEGPSQEASGVHDSRCQEV